MSRQGLSPEFLLNNHGTHRGGELVTCLRPMGSKVPSIHGGSYDEPFQMPQPAEAVPERSASFRPR